MAWGSESPLRRAALLGAALLCAVPAGAQTAAEKETARKLVKSGRAKLKAGEQAAAIEDLKAAHAIMNVPTTGLALGKAQAEARRWVEARDTLLAVTRLPVSGPEPYQFTKARKEAKQLANELEPRIPQLEIDLRGAPENATVIVSIDDVEVKRAALSAALSLNPGSHVIVARIDGREKRSEVQLSEGQKLSLVLDVTGIATAPKKAAAAPPPPESSPTNLLVPVGFGVAGAGVLVGSITGIMALSKKSSAEERCIDQRCPPSTHDDIDAGRTLGTVSTIAFVVGGVGAAVGVWGLMGSGASDEQERPPAARADVWLGVGSAGVRGRF